MNKARVAEAARGSYNLIFCRQMLIIENSIINIIGVGLCTLKKDRRGNSKELTKPLKPDVNETTSGFKFGFNFG